MMQLGYEIPEDEVRKKIEARDGRDFERVYVAEVMGEVVGIATCSCINVFHQIKPVGRITSLVVSESARGKGIGKSLIEKAEEYFLEKQCAKIEVTSGISRDRAHLFYKSQGFRESPKRFTKPLGS